MSAKLIAAAKAVVASWDTGAGNDLAGAVRKLADFLNDPDDFATDEEIQQARNQHMGSECEIDEPALASRGDGGVWVQAWVWISNEEEEAG